jgi:hypothetical protein
VTQLETVLGFRPPTPFAAGLREFVTWAMESDSDAAADTAAERELVARGLLRQGGR